MASQEDKRNYLEEVRMSCRSAERYLQLQDTQMLEVCHINLESHCKMLRALAFLMEQQSGPTDELVSTLHDLHRGVYGVFERISERLQEVGGPEYYKFSYACPV